MKIAVVLGILTLLMVPMTGTAAENLGAIQGSVRDTTGTPVVGALVIASAAASSLGERMAFTDTHGAFAIPNLLAGEYSVKVTMSRFLPALKGGIQLSSGSTAILSLNLQTAMDVFRRANVRDDKEAQDIVWILRTSRATQPVLRLIDHAPADSVSLSDYSGYLQIYSKSVESPGATTDGVGSRFSLTMPFQSHARMTVDGQYNESPDQPRGFGATYEFAPSSSRQSRVSVNARQSALLNGSFPGQDVKEIQIGYSEKLQLLKHVVFQYSGETGRSAGLESDHYFRPALGVSYVPDAKTTLGVSASTEAPAQADDPVRGKDYFEQVALLPPNRQQYRHAEVNASRIFSGSMKLSGAVFKDQLSNQTLFVTMPNGTRSFMIVSGNDGKNRSQGARVYVDRAFRGFDAGVGYTLASGLGISNGATRASSIEDIQSQIAQHQFHVFTARIRTDVDITNTELTAVYHWISPYASTTIDPYQSNVEYNDPTLSITIAQTLPTWGAIPGKVQAILDARNLFEQSAGNRGAQITNSPRFVKGGINIRF